MTAQMRAIQVWQRLLGCFGNSLVNKFGDEPPQEWVQAISGLSDDQLRQGIGDILKSGSVHAPTLPEFIKACRSAREFAVPLMPLIGREPIDPWGVEANMHMMGEVTRDAKYWHPDHVRGEPGPEGTRRTLLLVEAKNSWAQDMRDDPMPDLPSQKALWKHYVDRVREQIETRAAA